MNFWSLINKEKCNGYFLEKERKERMKKFNRVLVAGLIHRTLIFWINFPEN